MNAWECPNSYDTVGTFVGRDILFWGHGPFTVEFDSVYDIMLIRGLVKNNWALPHNIWI